MSPEVRSAWIGSGSALVVAVISAVTTYFVSVKTQTSQPDPIVIKEPYIVTQKEVIREYYSIDEGSSENNGGTEKTEDALGKATKEEIRTPEKSIEKISLQEQVKDAIDATELMMGKTIGIYYSYGDRGTKSKANQLVGRMRASGLNASYYSIGRFFSRPNIPSQTYIYGIGTDIDDKEFVESFRETYHFTGPIAPSGEVLDSQPVIEGDKWRLVIDKDIDIYIIIGT